jgi:hypothetical protein
MVLWSKCLHSRTYTDSLENVKGHGVEGKQPSLQAISESTTVHKVNERKGEVCCASDVTSTITFITCRQKFKAPCNSQWAPLHTD